MTGNCKIRVEFTKTGKVFEMETDDCIVGMERGIKSMGDHFTSLIYETGYSTIIIHATKIIANEMRDTYFKTEETHLEPYLEIW